MEITLSDTINKLLKSLLMLAFKTQLLSLPDDYVVYSGHGPATSIGHEKLHNPFL